VIQVQIQYFAVLREQAGRAQESRETAAANPADLYEEVRQVRGLTLPRAMLKVAINDEFCEWAQPLRPGDRVVFIPPVAGG
jgi:molybdopterin converting factor small subunit